MIVDVRSNLIYFLRPTMEETGGDRQDSSLASSATSFFSGVDLFNIISREIDRRIRFHIVTFTVRTPLIVYPIGFLIGLLFK